MSFQDATILLSKSENEHEFRLQTKEEMSSETPKNHFVDIFKLSSCIINNDNPKIQEKDAQEAEMFRQFLEEKVSANLEQDDYVIEAAKQILRHMSPPKQSKTLELRQGKDIKNHKSIKNFR